jgi:mRNA interferase RelE/StbE
MPVYRIEYSRPAEREFLSFPAALRARIASAVNALTSDPRPPGCRKLVAKEKDTYRIRVGDYRVIYRVHDNVLLVLVVRVGHRSKVYR